MDYRKSLYLAQPILIRHTHLYAKVCFTSGTDSNNKNHGLHMMTKQYSVKVVYSSKMTILTVFHLWRTISIYGGLSLSMVDDLYVVDAVTAEKVTTVFFRHLSPE